MMRTGLTALAALLSLVVIAHADDRGAEATRAEKLATAHVEKGGYAEAEALLQKALELRRRQFGESAPETARSLTALAVLLGELGRHAEARPLLQKALEIHRATFTDRHAATADCLINIAQNSSEMGNYEDSAAYHSKALEVHRKLFTEKHAKTAGSYSDLGTTYHAAHDFARAIENHRKALALRVELFGQDHPATALSHHNLAASLDATGERDEARKHYRTALEVRRRVLRSDHPDVAVTLAALGGHFHARREFDEAKKHWTEAAEVFDRARPPFALIRRRVSAVFPSPDAALAALHARAGEGREAWRRLERVNRQRTATGHEGNEQETRPPESTAPPAGDYDLERVQKHLPPEAAMVAWLDLPPSVPDAPPEDWACVVRSRGEPIWIPLHLPLDVEGLPGMLRGMAAEAPVGKPDGWQGPAARLAAMRVTPLRPYLATTDDLPPVKHLIVLPSPAMAGLPLEMLLPDGKDAPTVSYSPSATLFAWLAQQPAPRSRQLLLALADPVYREATREARGGGGRTWPPETRHEVEVIAGLFPGQVSILGKDATEARLDELARSRGMKGFGVIHLAVPAVADPVVPARSTLYLTDEGLPDPADVLLAGRPATTGRLTADRILRTWPLDADVVTLSACEAGAEGSVGFTQALCLAGSRSVVVSRWRADDRATGLLMMRFYSNLLGARVGLERPLPKAVALAEAKRWLRTVPLDGAGVPGGPPAGDVRPYAHPHYWAGFILAGDPGDVSVSLPDPLALLDEPQQHESDADRASWIILAVGLGVAAGVGLWVWRRGRRADRKV